MENIVELIVQIISSLCIVIPLVIELVKYVKKSIKEKNWQAMIELAFSLMSEAEGKFTTGEEKADYVVKMVKAAADQINYDIDEVALRNLITKTIALTKNVNVKKAAN